MNSILQSPPVPPECDVSAITALPLDISKLRDSKAYITAQRDSRPFLALMSLLMRAWQQVPAASLPADDDILSAWANVPYDVWIVPGFKELALQGFRLATDGNLYHTDLAAQALELWTKAQKRAAYIAGQRLHGLKAHTKPSSTHPSVTETPTEAKPVIATEATSETKPSATEETAPAIPAPESFALVAFDVDAANAAEATAKAKRNAEIKDVFDYWSAVLAKGKNKLDAKRTARINARLTDGFSVEDLKLAIRGVKNSPYHMGDNNGGTVYTGIETIFRDVAQVEKFMGLGETGQPQRVMSVAAEATANAFMSAFAAVRGGGEQQVIEEQQLTLIGE